MNLFNQLKHYLILMRFHKPTGIYLLLLPCLWSIAIASNNIDIRIITIFVLGSIVTRAAGCIINDLVDIKIDKYVERTKYRPLTSGKVSIKEAIILILILAFFALILLLNLNIKAMYIAFIAPFLIVLYPFMKRVTYFPQVILGVTFNLGVLMANAAINGKITNAGIYLYIAAIFWTLGYDTIYAHQDKIYDQQIGLKSTAMIFDKYPRLWIAGFYILMLIFLVLSAKSANLKNMFFILTVALIIWFLLKLKKMDLNNPIECGKNFKVNAILGSIILIFIIISK